MTGIHLSGEKVNIHNIKINGPINYVFCETV